MIRTRRLGGAVLVVTTALAWLGAGAGSGAGAAEPGPTTTTTTVVGSPPATPAPPSAAEIGAKRLAVEQARKDAAAAAAAYARATAERARLDHEIGALDARIPRLQARIRNLKTLLADRAAALYRGGEGAGLTVIGEVSSGDLLGGGRVARLADAAQQSTDDQMDELDAAKAQLERDRDRVRAARDRQAHLARVEHAKANEIDAALRVASNDLQVMESKASFARYVAALERQRAAAGSASQPTAPQKQKPPADPRLAALVPVLNLRCPIAGPVTFSDGFGQPRSSWRVHQGTDIFAARGTPNVAIADGMVQQSHNKLGGNSLWLYAPDGNAFYYAHFDAFEGTFNADGARVVKKGEVIGYTGNSGNAAGGPVHTHFEVHPRRVGPINPYPLLREMCAAEAGLRRAAQK